MNLYHSFRISGVCLFSTKLTIFLFFLSFALGCSESGSVSSDAESSSGHLTIDVPETDANKGDELIPDDEAVDDLVPLEGTKVAFIADTGAGDNFQQVLNLIRDEQADLTIVAGDTSYDQAKDNAWDQMVRETLGADPVLIAAGNHDYGDSNFSTLRTLGEERLSRQSQVSCSGQYADKMTCRIANLYFVMSAIGSGGSQRGHELFVDYSLQRSPLDAWRICVWHKNQQNMQVGAKSNEVGWGVYEKCQEYGAIIATGHEHSYSRTHLMNDIVNQTVASTDDPMVLQEGTSMVFVSGLGGKSVRDQERGGEWWASIYTSTQGATHGALFATFYEDVADVYFKNIEGQVIDSFSIQKAY